MALTYSTMQELGNAAPDFNLPGVDGKNYSLKSFKNSKALLVIFMCNHCPYVIAVQGRINALAKKFAARDVAVVAINSNDSIRYPDDRFDAMKARAKEQGYVFPYLHDESQTVAKAYDAVCTPDFFLYENKSGENFILKYRGRLDDNWKDASAVTREDLSLAIESLLLGKTIEADQKPSMGCSIKWLA